MPLKGGHFAAWELRELDQRTTPRAKLPNLQEFLWRANMEPRPSGTRFS